MQKRLFIFSFILTLLAISCVPESKKILTEVDIDSSDPFFQKIMNFEYEQNLDSLIPFLNDENPT